MGRDGLFAGWRECAAEWAATKDRLRELHLFGSRAKGRYQQRSDVDIAYLLTGNERGEKLAFSMWEATEWEAELREALGLPVDLQFTDNADDLNVWAWVRQHGQLIYRKGGCAPLE